MSILADIATGNTETADVFFLIGLIVAVLAAIAAAVRSPDVVRWSPVLGWLAVACLGLAWLVL